MSAPDPFSDGVSEPLRFGAAVSEHPLPTHAIGEVIGDVVEQVGHEPDVAVLFVTAPLVGAVEDFVTVVMELLRPRALIGTTAVTVLAGRREAEEVPAVALWAGRFDRPPRLVRISAERTTAGIALEGFAPAADEQQGSLLLLADPFTFPTDGFLQDLRERHPGVRVVGGLASAARGPGGNRLVARERTADDGAMTGGLPIGTMAAAGIHETGAVGLLFDNEADISFAVSQGCRPVGSPFTVTGAERNRLTELAGVPAFEQLQRLLAEADAEERLLIQQGLHLGIVHDNSKLDFAPGDFLIRAVIDADQSSGQVIVGDIVPVGATVQFQVRDAASASTDLAAVLRNRTAASALAFSCNGRGTRLFDVANHDAELIADSLPHAATAGMFCAGEIGPVGRANHTHGFTASMILFH